jgi:hypothetical protein
LATADIAELMAQANEAYRARRLERTEIIACSYQAVALFAPAG